MGSRLRGRVVAGAVHDPGFREALRRRLEREEAKVSLHEEVATLRAGIERLHPDVCILDFDLADSGGADLARQARALGIPVVLVSAHLLPLENPFPEGLPTLTLPFGRKALLDLLTQVLNPAA
ncbi:MAG: response regulator [Candidatus Eisenbacteria bacterium]